ncbi:hypothetical protein RF11_15616 [Thelohanellus kitauei]|uniref:Tc1-like transposase DDE domain-containing protein n=1 Tax=Thelohanellus kitauei TaxID=669202 RepID=A0A0C2J7X7_THEKT|nr:hypothetical protein RF11_15616 [Thelohanellus kitauei]
MTLKIYLSGRNMPRTFQEKIQINIFFHQRNRPSKLTGIRATRVVHALRSGNYSVTCTMSLEGMVNFKIDEMAYNTTFSAISRRDISNLSSTRDLEACYLMDNVPFHKTEFVQNTIKTPTKSYLPDCIQGCPVENVQIILIFFVEN